MRDLLEIIYVVSTNLSEHFWLDPLYLKGDTRQFCCLSSFEGE